MVAIFLFNFYRWIKKQTYRENKMASVDKQLNVFIARQVFLCRLTKSTLRQLILRSRFQQLSAVIYDLKKSAGEFSNSPRTYFPCLK